MLFREVVIQIREIPLNKSKGSYVRKNTKKIVDIKYETSIIFYSIGGIGVDLI